MAFLIPFCVWMACPGPAPIAEVAPVRTVSTAVAPDTYRGMGSDVEQWRDLVSGYFSDVDKALCVVLHESGGNADARNPTSGAAGLFQIMPFWWDAYGGDRYDPETNVALAAVILDQQGWGAWSVVNRGLC